MHCCRRHIFAIKALLCNTQYFYTVAGDSSTPHTECSAVFPLQNCYVKATQCYFVCTFAILYYLIFSVALHSMSSSREPKRIIKTRKLFSWRIKVKHYAPLFSEIDGGQRSSSLNSCFVLRVIIRVHTGNEAGCAPGPAWTLPLLVC